MSQTDHDREDVKGFDQSEDNSILIDQEDLHDDEESGSDPSNDQDDLDMQDDDNESIREALRKAQDTSVRKDQLRKEARAETRERDDMLASLVQADESNLERLHEDNPQLANRISKQVYGKSYDAWNDSRANNEMNEDIPSLVESYLHEREEQSTKQQIEEVEVETLASLGLKPGSSAFKKVIKNYKNLGSPKSVEQVRAFISYASGKPLPSVDNDRGVPSSPKSRTSPRRTSQVTRNQSKAAQYMGIDSKAFRDWKSKRGK